jgi:hypothetical protein
MTNPESSTAAPTAQSKESKIEQGLHKVAEVIKDAFTIDPAKPESESTTDSNQVLQGNSKIPPKPL